MLSLLNFYFYIKSWRSNNSILSKKKVIFTYIFFNKNIFNRFVRSNETLSRLEEIKGNFLRFFRYDRIFSPRDKTRSTSSDVDARVSGVNSLHGTPDTRDRKPREIGPRASADASIKSRSYYYRLFHSLSRTNFSSLSSTFSALPFLSFSPPPLLS